MRETESFAGTKIQELVDALDGAYSGIEASQVAWKEANPFRCPSGCGSCCVDFEPDVIEAEALYLAAWMLFHQRPRAEALAAGRPVPPRSDGRSGCFLFDPDSPLHCTVYGGRCLVCRLFGYTGDRGKDGLVRWKPCKFLPAVAADGGEGLRKQYSGDELVARFGAVPPTMVDLTAQAVALSPESALDRKPLREALPLAIGRIMMLERLAGYRP